MAININMTIFRLSACLIGLWLALAPASAARLERSAPEEKGSCVLTCETRQGSDEWKAVTQCFSAMTKTQCDALADHRNKSDAYPNRMRCKAEITQTCAVSQ